MANATEHTVELRALMRVKDSGTARALCGYVREKLIDLMQRRYPISLPKLRAELRELASRPL